MLARELAVLSGRDRPTTAAAPDRAGTGRAPGEVRAVSMPFGRCGLDGLPVEHLRVYHSAEAFLEVLEPDGPATVTLAPGGTVALRPGRVARLWARAVAGRRVVVAFQTEDRTPLLGNAAAFSLDGHVPEGYADRLRVCHAAFDLVRGWAATDRTRYGAALERFFAAMAERVQTDPRIRAAQSAARASGTYSAADQAPLFARQRAMLTGQVLARLEAGDPELCRFPGMFGAIATLYRLLPEAQPSAT
jgi:hypothetical protein